MTLEQKPAGLDSRGLPRWLSPKEVKELNDLIDEQLKNMASLVHRPPNGPK